MERTIGFDVGVRTGKGGISIVLHSRSSIGVWPAHDLWLSKPLMGAARNPDRVSVRDLKELVMVYWVLGVLFAVWLFFRIVAHLVMWPDKLSQCQSLREYLYSAVAVVVVGVMLNVITWLSGGQ